MTKGSKSKSRQTSQQKRKKATIQDLQKMVAMSQQQEMQKPKRRLRKLKKNKDSQDEDFVPEKSDQQEEYNISDIQDQEQEKFQRYGQMDDQDLKKQKQKEEEKKKRKKLKNNQEIDKFMEKQPKKQAKKSKQEPNVQMNLAEMFKKTKQRKQQLRKKQPSPQPQINSEDISEDESDKLLMIKNANARENYYNRFQGNIEENINQEQLLEKAKQLSLDSAKKQKKNHQQTVNLDDFAFDDNQKPTGISKPAISKRARERSQDKSHSLSEEKPLKKSVTKKSATKKNPKKQKQQKQGPLGGQTVVFTGEFQPYSKDQLIELCQKLGANTPKSFLVKTTVLLQGSFVVDAWKRRINQDMNTTKKSQQARKKGVRIVPNKDLDDFFIEKTGKSLQQHFSKNPTKLDGFVERQKPDDSNIKMEIQINKEKVNENIRSSGFHQLWTDKYKPKTLDQVIGQGNQIRQLRQWLADWEDVVLRGNKKDAVPQRGFLPAGSINSRAALLSGDPGLGKTTTARLLAQQLNYNITQFNASDIRNKKGVGLLQSNSYGILSTSNLVKNLIIMDQVDGMSKGDRGGITQIINMIKTTTVPIICICNDRQSQKIRSLAGHCYDIKFHKPDKRLIVKRLHQIVNKQGGKASDLVLNRIVQTFQNDMRQILTYLQLMFKTKTNQLQISDIEGSEKFTKDSGVMLTHFDATRKLLNRLSLNNMTVRDKLDCFFIDSDFVPIMVHQNYLSSMKSGKPDPKQFHKLVKATQGFVLADQIDRKIRKQQDWGLMPSYGYMAAVYTSQLTASSLGFPQFPSWLGKFSSQRKQKRLIRELKQSIHVITPATNNSIRYGQAAILYQEINYLLKHQKVDETLDFMQQYNLSPIIMNEVLLPLQFNPSKSALLPDVTASTKTKLTKAFNKRHQQIKLRGKVKKVTAPAAQHHKYNEVLEQMADEDFINDEQIDEQNQQSQNVDGMEEKKPKKSTKKGGKAGPKKK